MLRYMHRKWEKRIFTKTPVLVVVAELADAEPGPDPRTLVMIVAGPPGDADFSCARWEAPVDTRLKHQHF